MTAIGSRPHVRLRSFAARLRGFLSRPHPDDGFDDEIQEHVRLLADRFVAQGMSGEDAALAARRQFGTTLLHEDRRAITTPRAFSPDQINRDFAICW